MTIDVEGLKVVLRTLRDDTEASLCAAELSTKPVILDQTMVGRLSRIDAIQQQEMALASERRRIDILVKIDLAFKRIESGGYGYCIKCDEEIAEKRLMLDPTVLNCVICASENQ